MLWPWTYLLLSSSMVVVISLCSSSSNLLFWDLFLQQRAQRQLGRGNWTDTQAIDPGKSAHAGYPGPVKFCLEATWLMPFWALVRKDKYGLWELRRGSVPDAECRVLEDLCEILHECFCRASAWKPPYSLRKETLTQMHRPRYTQVPGSDQR